MKLQDNYANQRNIRGMLRYCHVIVNVQLFMYLHVEFTSLVRVSGFIGVQGLTHEELSSTRGLFLL